MIKNKAALITSLGLLVQFCLNPLAVLGTLPKGYLTENHHTMTKKDYKKLLSDGQRNRYYFTDVRCPENLPQFQIKEYITSDFIKTYVAPILYYQIKESKIKFDAILTIPRGGLYLSQLLAYMMDLSAFYVVQAKSYDSIVNGIRGEVQLGPLPDLSEHANVLIIDELIDSGATLQTVLAQLQAQYPNTNFVSASGFLSKDSSIQPNFHAFTKSGWIVFDYEGLTLNSVK